MYRYPLYYALTIELTLQKDPVLMYRGSSPVLFYL